MVNGVVIGKTLFKKIGDIMSGSLNIEMNVLRAFLTDQSVFYERRKQDLVKTQGKYPLSDNDMDLINRVYYEDGINSFYRFSQEGTTTLLKAIAAFYAIEGRDVYFMQPEYHMISYTTNTIDILRPGCSIKPERTRQDKITFVSDRSYTRPECSIKFLNYTLVRDYHFRGQVLDNPVFIFDTCTPRFNSLLNSAVEAVLPCLTNNSGKIIIVHSGNA